MLRRLLTFLLTMTLVVTTVSPAYATDCSDFENELNAVEKEMDEIEASCDADVKKARADRNAAIIKEATAKGEAQAFKEARDAMERKFLESEARRMEAEASAPSRLVWFGLGVGTTIVGVLAVFIALR